jgi:DNA modification methylase
MAKIEITRTELVWPGKYNDDGARREVLRVKLPFQVIETVHESRASREASKLPQERSLFEVWEGREGSTFEDGWKNKLIWGDNLLVMGSLRDKFAGKIDLIYIDPPFATGADFSFVSEIGEGGIDIQKEQSIIEEKAYRDTWGRGLSSYLEMMAERLRLISDLLSPNGALYVHLDYHVGHYIKVILDEIFGQDNLLAEIIWKRKDAQSFAKGYGVVHDTILAYVRGDNFTFNKVYRPLSEETANNWYTNEEAVTNDLINRLGITIRKGTVRRFNKADISAPGDRQGTKAHYEWKSCWPPKGRHWQYTYERMVELEKENRLIYSSTGRVYEKRYLDESKGTPLQTLWDDVSQLRGMSKHSEASEWLDYNTQKPEALLERVISVSSNPGDLIADFFCGSGTTLAVAEKLGRRWIGCDLGRFAIHTTRKRLLEIENCKPFEILNLGRYERQYWQGVSFTSNGAGNGKTITEQALYEYLAFILKLYGAQPVAGLQHLHGKKGKAMVHIGSVDAPVTIDEINDAVADCARLKQTELHVLGWEWEMGLAGPNDHRTPMSEIARRQGVKLVMMQIPREVMEQQAADKGDVKFFELAYLEIAVKKPKKLTAAIELKDFVIPNTELIPEEVRAKVKKWSDYIDYWAVDWDFRHDTFMQGWVAYRTRKDRALALASDAHTYEKAGRYRALVKVIDIFGNDTSQAVEIEVK